VKVKIGLLTRPDFYIGECQSPNDSWALAQKDAPTSDIFGVKARLDFLASRPRAEARGKSIRIYLFFKKIF